MAGHFYFALSQIESGTECGDQIKCLNFTFMGNAARYNAEALRQLLLAPVRAWLTVFGLEDCAKKNNLVHQGNV
jgi:hypothetical protein